MNYLANFINLLFTILYIAILIRILLSWIRVNPYNPLVQLLYQITEPVLAPFRRVIPPVGGMDFSPIVALIVLQLVQQFLVSILLS